MNIMPTKAVAAAAVLAASGAALAGPIVSFDYEGTAQGRNLDVAIAGFYTGRVFAGSVNHKIDGVMTLTYCIDPNQFDQTGVANFEQTDLVTAFADRPNGAAKAAVIAELADSLGDAIWTDSADRDTAAAFQVAVWEIIADLNPAQRSISLDFTSGDFRASGDNTVLGLASNMLAGLAYTQQDANGYTAFINADYQDFMARTVPTPGTAALLLAGAPMLAPRRRRRA